jgi:hypothetical protein
MDYSYDLREGLKDPPCLYNCILYFTSVQIFFTAGGLKQAFVLGKITIAAKTPPPPPPSPVLLGKISLHSRMT